ncbi:MAG: PAS domain S-box protein [Burkholderiaceae bacterium]|nr:PAS domain S-box protein [Burkholderiaceae bacterium]
MSPALAPSISSSAEISALIDLLHTTDRRLDELLGGEVDSVTDPAGHTIVLRRAQADLRQSEHARQVAILNAVPAHIALVDSWGTIVSVNKAWRDFGSANQLPSPSHAVGLNYVDICENAHGEDSSEAQRVAFGLRSVLTGESRAFSIEYACHSPTEKRWFLLNIAPLSDDPSAGAVVMHVNITERRQAAETLEILSGVTERRERMLSTMLSSISDEACILDREGHFLFANQRLLDRWGVKAEEAAGRTFSELGYPVAVAKKLLGQVQQVFDTTVAVSDERPYVTRTGAAGSLEYILSPALAADASVDFVVGIGRDITQRKNADTALRESEAEFRTLAEAMPQMVWVRRSDGQALYFSRQWMDYTGLGVAEAMGNDWAKPFHPDDRQATVDAWQHAIATKRTYSIESRLRRADGAYRWWLIRAVPLLAADGTVVKWIGTCTDIDDLKIAELKIFRVNAELRRQQTELRVLFDLMPAMIWFKDTENNILRVNQRVASIAGLKVEDIEGRPSHEIYPREAAKFHADNLKVIASGVPMLGIVESVQDGEGDEIWIQTDKVPYYDEHGNAIGIVVMAQDISQRKRDQDTLRELNADLEARVQARTAELKHARDEADQANHAKSAFLATMSHEIRTPMNGVIGMIEVLNQTSLQGSQVEMINLIRDSAFSLLQIIEDILDFSKIEAGKLDVENAPMQLADTVEKVCGMLDHLAIKRGVRMTVFIDPAIPRTVIADQSRLRQVCVNLIGNAIKFSGGSANWGQVSVRGQLVERHADAVTVDLIIADNGIGIDEETLGRLFKPFSQADASTTRRFGGSGLGLAISSMLVQLMKGSISVHSVPDQGSTFTVRLRLATADIVTIEPEPETEAWADGLQCRVIGADSALAQDIGGYLSHANVVVARSTDLAAAAVADAPTGLSLWILLPGVPVPPLDELRAMAPRRADAETRFVALGWGNRRRPRVEAIDLVLIDVDTLARRNLFRVLAIASGRLREVAAREEPAASEWSSAPLRREAQLAGRRILVAEDNETNRIVIRQQLALIGFAADIAADGREALERWRTGDFALLLTDLHMPLMDGYELTKAIRSEETAKRRMPILALTANALRDEEVRCRAVGMDGYLSKPVRLAQLSAAIEEWIMPLSQSALQEGGRVLAAVEPPPVDLSVLAALVGDDSSVIDEVLGAFRESAGLSSDALRQGVAAGSGQIVSDAAHKLKSAARSIGALRLGDLCAQIEEVAGGRKTGKLKALLPLFQTESEAVLRFLDSR